MTRRMEDRIRNLCRELAEGKNDEQQIEKLIELRRALHTHIEKLRARLTEYPLALDLRTRDELSRPETALETIPAEIHQPSPIEE